MRNAAQRYAASRRIAAYSAHDPSVNHELVNDCAKSAPFKVKSRLITQVIVLSAKRAVETTPGPGAQQLLNENF